MKLWPVKGSEVGHTLRSVILSPQGEVSTLADNGKLLGSVDGLPDCAIHAGLPD